MAAVVIGGTARARWLTGLAGLRARGCAMARRAIACAVAAVMVCAVGVALLHSLRWRLRARATHRDGPRRTGSSVENLLRAVSGRGMAPLSW
jgi:hypothetical protein